MQSNSITLFFSDEGLFFNVGSPEVFLEFLELLSDETIYKMAECPNISEENLKTILEYKKRHPHGYVGRHIAKNPSASAEILSELAKSWDEYVKLEVAKNLNTSAETLDELAKDSSIELKKEVAKNPNTSEKTLSKIAKDIDKYNQFVAEVNSSNW